MFCVGDRVEYINDNQHDNENIRAGSRGTVYNVYRGDSSIGVCWDDYVCGHTCGGTCRHGHGWVVSAHELRLCSENSESAEIYDPKTGAVYSDMSDAISCLCKNMDLCSRCPLDNVVPNSEHCCAWGQSHASEALKIFGLEVRASSSFVFDEQEFLHLILGQ